MSKVPGVVRVLARDPQSRDAATPKTTAKASSDAVAPGAASGRKNRQRKQRQPAARPSVATSSAPAAVRGVVTRTPTQSVAVFDHTSINVERAMSRFNAGSTDFVVVAIVGR